MNADSFAAALELMRREAGLSQRELSVKSGVGRVESMKLWQFLRLTEACGVAPIDAIRRVQAIEELGA